MVQFISNNINTDHEDALKRLFDNAQRLDWHIAFASREGVAAIESEFRAFLEGGHTARVIIGLDYFHTDPGALEFFYNFSKEYPGQLEFYISAARRQWIFHPKVYVFHYVSGEQRSAQVVIGSANLTSGGLGGNFEFSARLILKFDENGKQGFIDDLERHTGEIIASNEVTRATEELIETYRTKHYFHKLHKDIAERRAEKAIARVAEDSYEYYRVMLEKYRAEPEPLDFHSQVQSRLENGSRALDVLREVRRQATWSRNDFLEQYRLLVSPPCHYFHSGGINRSQEAVADDRKHFVAGLASLETLLKRGLATPARAYDTLLEHFLQVKGAGVNLITEILHAYDNNSYAVMNGLSVSQLCRVSSTPFPSVLNKENVSGAMYEAFCAEAKNVCKALSLSNFTEFDALMNYDYWK